MPENVSTGPHPDPMAFDIDNRVSREVVKGLQLGIETYNGVGDARHFGNLSLSDQATFAVADVDLGHDFARWTANKLVISVPVGDERRFPTFQFAARRPLPVIGKVLALLPSKLMHWQIAFWFVSSNSWLGGPVPVKHLDDQRSLLFVAKRESEEIGG